MANLIKLNIISPSRDTITENVISLKTAASDGEIVCLANCAPIIIATVPTATEYTSESGEQRKIFTSSGIIYIKDNIINFCCDSANYKEEIDIKRAEEAKERAENRLKGKEDIDIERAIRSLARANARLSLK